MDEFLELERVRQLKYRYFRALDRHDWAALADCLAPELNTWLDSGKYSFDSRDAFIAGIRKLMDNATLLTKHQGHHPDRAKGTWYLEDHVIDLANNWMLHGTAFYEDEYVKRDGEWRIISTGYRRVFETVTAPIPDTFKVTANMFAPA
ncbi:bile acid 7-alpha dehydratase [Cupriavidus sp. UYMMa02A]|nr:bile acid 7-alpha dehydratase [Cupriavidus sp. UYMMa02A]